MLKPEFTGQFKKDFTLAVKRGCKSDSLYHKVLGNVFSNLLLGTDYELKNRYMHIDYVEGNRPQSINSKVPKYQFDTLDCPLEELSVLELVAQNPKIKQQELVNATGRSIATVKRITSRQPSHLCKLMLTKRNMNAIIQILYGSFDRLGNYTYILIKVIPRKIKNRHFTKVPVLFYIKKEHKNKKKGKKL